MKKLLFSLFASLPLYVFAAQIEFDAAEISRTVAPEVEKSAFEFPFKVTGEGKLDIASITPSCTCLKDIKTDKTSYSAGEVGKLSGDFATEGMPGAQHKQIVVKVAGNDKPYVLTLKFLVQEYLRIYPKVIFAGSKDTKGQLIRIHSNYDSKLSDFTANTHYQNVKLELLEGKKPNDYELKVIPEVGAKPGRAEIKISYKTPSGTSKNFTVHAMIR